MTTRPDYLRYLESARQAETADRLRGEGFLVEMDKQVGRVRFDLAATKCGRTVVYEFEAASDRRLTREELCQLQTTAAKAGYEFHLVLVSPPQPVHVEVDDLAAKLLAFVAPSLPVELNLSNSGNRRDRLLDIDIKDIGVGVQGMKLRGQANLEVSFTCPPAMPHAMEPRPSMPFLVCSRSPSTPTPP